MTGTVINHGNEVQMEIGPVPGGQDAKITVSYVKPSADGLRDRAGNQMESFSGQPVTNGMPMVESVALVSDAGPDRTYGFGEQVRLLVTFDTAVSVNATGGRPRLKLDLTPESGGQRWAHYAGGDETDTLTFAYTVAESDVSTAGIAVPRNPIDLNGGKIESFSLPRETADLHYAGLPHNRAHRVDAGLPGFQSAAVDGKTLTMTFTVDLDGGSVPSHGAFRVTVNGARRSVVSGGVAVLGNTVTLTLASPVAHGDTVTVRYTRPSAMPLQTPAGVAVGTFADQAVTNNTPAGAIWSATLTVRGVSSGVHGCLGTTQCSGALTGASFTYAGTDYQVERVYIGQRLDYTTVLSFKLDKALPSDWTLHVDGRQYRVADASLSDSDKVADWQLTGFDINRDWPVGFRSALTLAAATTSSDSGGGSGLIGQQEVLVPAVSVTRVSVVSDPGADKTYGSGDTIQVQVTFNQLVVNVDTSGGTPRLKIDMDPAEWGEKWASYASGSGTANLIFTHTVVEPNISTQGIAVLESTLELNGGTIRSGDEDAGLAHTGLAHDANHKVNWETEPDGGGSGQSGSDDEQSEPASVSVVSVSSSPRSGATYGGGETISITLTFSESVDVTGTPRLKIDMDPADWGEKWASYSTGSGTATLTFTYTVVEPNISTQGIAVLANTLELNGGTIQASGVDADLSHTGAAHNSNHKVDWRLPQASVTDVSIASDPGDDDTYAKDDVISITLTFDETVNVTGTPRLKIDMDPADWGEKWASYSTGSGTTSLTFTYTVVEPNISTQGIAVLANTLELNGGTIRSGSNNAILSHTGLAHDAEHKVDWRPPTPAVESVEITSDPGDDDTYGLNDVIRISVTFSEAVDVTGAPQLSIDMDPAEWGKKQASYSTGSGSTTLVFAYTVAEPNISTQGIAVLANSLALNGGDIGSSATDADADLSHTGLAHDADHKVDWQQSGGGPGS